MFGVAFLAMVGVTGTMAVRQRSLRMELERYRREVGYLQPSGPGSVAAARVPIEDPLWWRMRVRVPDGAKYRLTYGTLWERNQTDPKWYGAVPIRGGESRITVRLLVDPRDGRWKISAIVADDSGTRRMGTTLPPDQVQIFRGSHQRLRTGITTETVTAAVGQSIRLLDERWLVGEGALMLFGDSAPRSDQIGVFAELQPDRGVL